MNLQIDEQIKRALDAKIVEACGCTEPIAIAYAAAYAHSLLKAEPVKIRAALSANVIKNALIVCLPSAGGKYGIPLALAMGGLYGDSAKVLNVISGLSAEQVESAEKFAAKNVEVDFAKSDCSLYIAVSVYDAAGNCAEVVIRDFHTNVVKAALNGKIIVSAETAQKQETSFDFGINDVWEYATATDDFALADKIIRLNGAVSDEGLKTDYGLRVGKSVCAHDLGLADKLLDNMNYILQRTTAGVDARMAGADLPVMSNSGSGNQGLIASLPVIAAAEVLGCDEDKKRRAVLLSGLIVIHIKSKHSALSAYCGAVLAATGVAAGIAYLAGGDLGQIRMAIQNVLGNNFGMVCDGAKETCSLKVASCTFSAIYSAYLALKSICPKVKEGVLADNVEKSIDNIAEIAKNTSDKLDEELIGVMLKKI